MKPEQVDNELVKLEVSLTDEQVRQLPSDPITLIPAHDDYEFTLVETDEGIVVRRESVKLNYSH